MGYAGAVRAAAAQQSAPAHERPHILMIMDDQHRADCLGVDGNRSIHTPNLDRLAREGAYFRCAYSSTPTCTPARAALLTGLSPWNHGMLGYGRIAPQYQYQKPQALRDAGYQTLAIGKNHFTPQRNSHGYHQIVLDESGRVENPEFRSDYRAWFWSQAPGLNPDATGIGFNDFRARAYALPEELHPTRWTADTAINFIRNYDGKRPFFTKVSFARPHSPYDPPERFLRMYRDARLPEAQVGSWAARYAARSDDSNNIWHGDMGPAQVRHSRQGYYGSVSFLDEQIGRIVEALEKRGWLEQTLILFFSDHGDMTGDHHLWRKSYAYEASARIPMLMRWPKGLIAAERGQSIAAPVEIRDILPTLLDAAGVTPARKLDGGSLLQLAGGAADWRKHIDLEHDVCYSPANHWNALTDGSVKYIFHARDGEEQLFDLKADPGELRDLAGQPQHSATLREWRGRMLGHLSERGEPFVKGGKLALRPEKKLYSPAYPSQQQA